MKQIKPNMRCLIISGGKLTHYFNWSIATAIIKFHANEPVVYEGAFNGYATRDAWVCRVDGFDFDTIISEYRLIPIDDDDIRDEVLREMENDLPVSV